MRRFVFVLSLSSLLLLLLVPLPAAPTQEVGPGESDPAPEHGSPPPLLSPPTAGTALISAIAPGIPPGSTLDFSPVLDLPSIGRLGGLWPVALSGSSSPQRCVSSDTALQLERSGLSLSAWPLRRLEPLSSPGPSLATSLPHPMPEASCGSPSPCSSFSPCCLA